MLPPAIVSIEYPAGADSTGKIERELRVFSDDVAAAYDKQVAAAEWTDDYRPRRPITYLQSATHGRIILTAIIS